MRSVLGSCGFVAIVSLGCGCEEAAVPPPVTSGAAVGAPAATAPAKAADTTPPSPQKQLLTITTNSPDAKAALLKAWDLLDNGRNEEAVLQVKQALKLAPDFALAHTLLGMMTPGAGAQAELDKGVQLSASLPDAERAFIAAQAAFRHADLANGFAAMKRVADLAADDYHAQAWYGYTLLDHRDFTGAITQFNKVLALNPGAIYVYTSIAWADTQLRKYDDAVAAARKYAEGAPNEGGSHQALAVALLNVGQTKDAEVELQKGLDLSPKARSIYYDLATVKSIAGDYVGARDVLDKSKATEVQDSDGLERANRTAWALLAAGKQADAFALLDATEKDSDARKLVWPDAEAQTRARALWISDKPADALKTIDAAMPRCGQPEASDGHKAECRLTFLITRAMAQIDLRKAADAQQTLAKLKEEEKYWQGNDWFRVILDMLSDQVAALSSKDPKAAAAVLAKCPPDSLDFKLSILHEAQKAGDKDGAEQVRKDLLSRPINDPMYPLVARAVKK
jgi:Flp pilus assembly protein TadD